MSTFSIDCDAVDQLAIALSGSADTMDPPGLADPSGCASSSVASKVDEIAAWFLARCAQAEEGLLNSSTGASAAATEKRRADYAAATHLNAHAAFRI